MYNIETQYEWQLIEEYAKYNLSIFKTFVLFLLKWPIKPPTCNSRTRKSCEGCKGMHHKRETCYEGENQCDLYASYHKPLEKLSQN